MPINWKGIELKFLSRFPKGSHIAGVYAIIIVMIYSWTIIWFFWKLPSWLHFMQIPEILAVLSVSMVTDFLESVIVLFLTILLAMVLPKSWFSDVFIIRGTSLVLLTLGYLMFFAFQFPEESYPKQLILLSPLFFIVFFFLVYLSTKVSFIGKVIESLAGQAVIFLYIYIPISILSVVIWLVLFIPIHFISLP